MAILSANGTSNSAVQNSLPECFASLKNFEPDRLLPLKSAEYVVKHGSGQLSISPSGITAMAEWMLSKYRNNEAECIEFSAHEMHPKTADLSAINWVFLIDTINFSFWSEEDEKFFVTYKGKKFTGYFGACACVNRAIDAGIPMTDAHYMKNVTVDTIKEIFKSDDGQVMPLIERRAEAIAEAGRVLLEKFDGTFYTCLQKCEKSAMKLLAIVVENFESYRDYAVYKGQKISILKRAQILVGDIYNCLKGKNELTNFSDIREITMFADYRVPQVLAYFSVLEYSPELEKTLKSKVMLEPGSESEVELRAYSIKAVEDAVQKVKELRTESDAGLPEITAVDVDNMLWLHRRQCAKEIEAKIDYHRVRTIYY